MNTKRHIVEFVDELPAEVEEKMRKDLVEYEKSHGIAISMAIAVQHKIFCIDDSYDSGRLKPLKDCR